MKGSRGLGGAGGGSLGHRHPVALLPDPSTLVNSLQLKQTPVVKRRPAKLPVAWKGPHSSMWEVNLPKLWPQAAFFFQEAAGISPSGLNPSGCCPL